MAQALLRPSRMFDPNDTPGTRQVRALSAEGGLELIVIAEGKSVTFPLPEVGECVIGRSKECDIRVDEASLSRRHARLRLGTELSIEDLGALNGTKVRDQRIEPGRATTIQVGEVVDVGTAMMVVQRRRHHAHFVDVGVREAPHDAVAQLHRLADRIAPGMINVLIHGETGAGKEVLAARIHARSARADKAYLRINCAALSDSLVESELFGHERGAFTGAAQSKPGLLETADGGTVLLDEIGELPMGLQVKLLRVIEQKEVLRVGGLTPRAIDVRFLAATNRALEDEVREGRFREDLYFRLAGITLTVPPLRARPEEIPGLAHTLVAEASARIGRAPNAISTEALATLCAYRWQGNVRELRNTMERAALLAGDGAILPEHLSLDSRGRSAGGESFAAMSASPSISSQAEAERRQIVEALARAGGNQTKAAKLLGIGRRTLTNRLNAFKLPRPRKP